ncbi:hypothetical protein LLEC1_07421 [Akanthomyces lecanii]|uniref:chitinase n=1 Tax=Cordyceps confragosa TaxID=2714763 RepID=A0A179IML6_CORDF|nr:hypothetical protein LLEC1_07421 [Akanthomyces lecanii]
MKTSPLTLLAAATTAAAAVPRNVMYLDKWHKTTLPPRDVTAGINYVNTAFAPSTLFNSNSSYTPFIPLEDVRKLFDEGTKVCMSIGGWGYNEGFDTAAVSDESRKRYATNVADALTNLGYDCVDIDWEYPGGNGQDYKQNPNSGKVAEIDTYPLLLHEIKAAIGDKELSIAAPGKERDMIAYTAAQVPKIAAEVDFVNVVAYDLINRRDNVTKHHSSVEGSLATIETYLARGVPAGKLNLGFGFFAKWFTTKDGATCDEPTGCPTAVLENPDGSDPGLSGSVTFETENYSKGGAFLNAITNGKPDPVKGGQWYWDAAAKVYWTWDTPEFIARKVAEIVKAKKLGGVAGWSLGEDSHDWSHVRALQSNLKSL